MNIYEFVTEIKNGIIKIPDEFRGEKNGRFKVTIKLENDKREKLKEALMNAPVWVDDDVEEFYDTIEKGYENWNPEKF